MMVSAVVTARVLLWEVGSFAKKERDEQHYSTWRRRNPPPLSSSVYAYKLLSLFFSKGTWYAPTKKM